MAYKDLIHKKNTMERIVTTVILCIININNAKIEIKKNYQIRQNSTLLPCRGYYLKLKF